MKKFVSLIVVGVAAVVGGVVTLIVTGQDMTQGGLDADANGTSGGIPAGDYIQGAAGLLLVICGIALAVYGFVRWSRSRAQGT